MDPSFQTSIFTNDDDDDVWPFNRVVGIQDKQPQFLVYL